MAAPTIIPKSAYYDGVVTEGDRARGRAGAPDFTVYGPDELTLSPHPTIPFALVVKKGKASAYGVTAIVEAANGSDLVLQCDPNASGTRWDLVMIRYDWRPDVGGPSDIRAINAGGRGLPLTLENTPGSVVDQPLWLARWTGNASAPAELVDLRAFAANGGMVVNDIIAFNYLRKPGSSVKWNGTRYDFQPVGNENWDWVEDCPSITSVAAPAGWSVGPAGFFVTRTPLAGGKGLYNLTGQLIRNDGPFNLDNKFLGAVLPGNYRPADALDFHAGLNNANNTHLGSFSMRVTAAGLFLMQAINADYIIERYGNINFSGAWVA